MQVNEDGGEHSHCGRVQAGKIGGEQGHCSEEVGGGGVHAEDGDCGQLGVGVTSGTRKSMMTSMKSCHVLDACVSYEDYEANIYKAHSDDFDWVQVFGNDD